MPRLHPLFPTRQETSNGIPFDSDHLLVLADVPLSADNEDLKLRIASLNVLGGSSGLHYDGSVGETNEQTIARYTRMATGLAKNVQAYKTDVILLQEAAPALIEDSLKQALGDGWEIISDKETGLVTCYNAMRLELISTDLEPNNRIRRITVRDKNSDIVASVHNVWSIFDNFPHLTEEQYRTLLEKKAEEGAEVAVVFGDTNSGIAPIDNEPRNIITGVIPPVFNEDYGVDQQDRDKQLPDFPDGGFYQGSNGKIHQLKTYVCSLETGKVFQDERSKEEIDYWPNYKMVMCLDEYYKDTRVIKNQTIFQYQNNLNKELQFNNVLVRMAANTFNEKKLAIRFPPNSPIYQHLHSCFRNEPGFQFPRIKSLSRQDNRTIYDCIFVPLDQVGQLHRAIVNSRSNLRNQIITRLENECSRLSKFSLNNFFCRKDSVKQLALKRLCNKIKAAPFGSTPADFNKIIEDWKVSKDYRMCGSNSQVGTHTSSDVLAYRRCFFRKSKRAKLTASQEAINEITTALNPQP